MDIIEIMEAEKAAALRDKDYDRAEIVAQRLMRARMERTFADLAAVRI